jgi:ribonuclease HI
VSPPSAVAAIAVPRIDDGKRKGATERAREAAAASNAQRARLRADQRVHSLRVPAGADLVAALEAAITADAKDRVRAKVATIHFDGGGQSPGPVTAACTVELCDGSSGEHVERFDQGTHNTAEWHALILGLRMALAQGARHVVVYGDSMLVVKQINREWKTKDAALRSLRAQAEELLALFESSRLEWVPRMENRRADELGRMT